MIIKIIPPDETGEAITICPRPQDKVIIGECFNGFGISTDIGLYSICMRDGGIEILITPRGEHGEHSAKLVLSVDDALSVCPWEIQQAHNTLYSTESTQCGHGGQ